MLIIAIILFGMIVGAAARLILGKRGSIDWPMAFAAGLSGSFVGGLLISLLAGDGIALRPSGLIGSIVGAVIVTAAWQWWSARSKA